MKRILYVEDDSANALVIAKMLDDYMVDIAATGKEGLKKIKLFKYDLVIMDINLGENEMDGIEVMQTMRLNDSYKNIPFIAVTAYAMEEDRDYFISQGFDEYFPKPIKKFKLLEAVERYLVKS